MSDVRARARATLRYASDEELPGMLHARLVRSPHAHARVHSVDVSAVPGDVTTLTAADLGDVALTYGPLIEDQHIVAGDRVRYVGDVVAAVAAVDERRAREAVDAVTVSYEPLPGVFDPVEAARPDAPLVHERFGISDNRANIVGLRPQEGTNVCHRFRVRSGDAERGMAEADVVVRRRYRTPGAAHAALESHSALAWWQDGRLIVRTGTQTPFNTREALAKLFDLPEEDVRVEVTPMGGSFGCKTFPKLEPVVAALARKAGRPVRAVLDRDEDFLTLNRHPATIEVEVGATREGDLVGKRARAWWDTGAYADAGPSVAQKGGYAVIGPYRIPHVDVESLCVYCNLPPNGAFRGYAATQAVWASERCMDALAAELGMDSLALRLRNVLRDGDRFATGEEIADAHFEECLQACADAVGWQEGSSTKGLAVILKGMQTPSRAEAAVEVDEDGRFVVRTATTDVGQRPSQTQRQLVADALGVPIDAVRTAANDTDTAPYDTRTTSSRSTHMMAHALRAAGDALRKGLAQQLGCAPQDLVLSDAEVARVDEPARRWPLSDFAGLRGDGAHHNEGGLDPDTGQGVASTEWHQAAAAADVEVDPETGVLTVRRLHAACWAGKVIDRPGAELQTEGSIIMAIGTTLFEELDFSDGQLTNANLSDYSLPSLLDVPAFTYDLLEQPGSPPHGLGETALPPVPAAIGNALAAQGLDVTELPLHPERVLRAVDARDAAIEVDAEQGKGT